MNYLSYIFQYVSWYHFKKIKSYYTVIIGKDSIIICLKYIPNMLTIFFYIKNNYNNFWVFHVVIYSTIP